jgi:potassium-transporting ATPase KdpC subunit
VAHERRLGEAAVRDLVRKYTSQRDLGLLGEPRVNVLELNLDLDAQSATQ